MKAVKLIIVLIFVLGVSITFFPAAGYIAARLGMAGLALLSVRPDKNMDYEISITLPSNEVISFAEQIGCQHKVGVNGSGYSTLNRVSINVKDEWFLYGIDRSYGINKKYHSGYKIFNLSNNVSSEFYFSDIDLPAKVTSAAAL